MELLYVWVENCLPLEKVGLNFSNQYRFTEQINKEKRTFDLKITTNKQYLEGFFGTQVSNVTAIAGKNGVGKSNLLDFLKRLLTNSLITGEKWVAAFKDRDKILVYYSLSDLEYDKKLEKNQKWRIEASLEVSNEGIEVSIIRLSQNNSLTVIDYLKDCQAVFYSNIFDLRDYGHALSAESYIDISTNYLIYDDNEKRYGPDFDQVSIHQSREIERGFDFTLQRLYKIQSFSASDLSLNIPDQMKLHFCKLQDTPKQIYEDVSHEARIVHESLRDRIRTDYLNCEDRINDLQRKQATSSKINDAIRQKVKAWFLANLLDNFFHNYASQKDLDGKKWFCSLEDIQADDSTQALIQMFQKWRGGEVIINLINIVVDTLKSNSTEFDAFEYNDAIFSTNIKTAERIWKAYKAYRSHFPSGNSHRSYFRNLLKLDWRNMSSGEKALLSMYSRLYSVFNSYNFSPDAQTTYLLIDEGEVGLHPQWQKNFLKYLLEFLNAAFKHRVQLILTTHSPFVLSDLPNSNIIFLQKHGSKKTSSVDGLEDKKSTFGGNIHTLLADSFFVQGGLIGEFAKDKINHIIGLLKKPYQDITKQEKEEIVAITDMIGEPVVKSKIRSMIEEKLGINLMTIDERIRILEEEISNLKNRKE